MLNGWWATSAAARLSVVVVRPLGELVKCSLCCAGWSIFGSSSVEDAHSRDMFSQLSSLVVRYCIVYIIQTSTMPAAFSRHSKSSALLVA